MAIFNNQDPQRESNVGQFGATDDSIGAYKQAAEYAKDAEYWAKLSQQGIQSIDDLLIVVQDLYAKSELQLEDIEQLKRDFAAQDARLMQLISQTNAVIKDANDTIDDMDAKLAEVQAQLDILLAMDVAVTTLPPGSDATGDYNPDTGLISLGIPEGQPGKDGSVKDLSTAPIGVPDSSDWGFYVESTDNTVFRAKMSDIAKTFPAVQSISYNGGAQKETGDVNVTKAKLGLGNVLDVPSYSKTETDNLSLPYPDVWAPLNDDLRLLAGFAPYDKLTISGQVLELPTKSLTFSRATTATYIDKSGVLRIAAINEPRFEKEGLLIEGQSTNLLKWSSPIAAANEFRFGTGVSVAYLPSGGVEVTKIADSGSWFEQNTGTTNHDPASPASCSAYLTIPNGASVSFVLMSYNTTDGDKSVLSAPGVNGRNTLSVAAVGGTASQRLATRLTFPVGFPIGGKVVMDRMQIEPLAMSTSYIPTAGASATRATDDCTLQRSGNDNWWGPITFSMDVHCNGATASDGTVNSRRGILSFFPTNTEYALLMVESYGPNVGKYLFAYGNGTTNVVNLRVDDGAIHRLVATSDTQQNRGFVDGVTTGSPTQASRPTPGNVSSTSIAMYIGRNVAAAGQRTLNGHIRNLRIWHHALSDIQIKGIK